MMQQVLGHYHLPGLACAGLAIFIAVFVGAVAWVCRRDGRIFYDTLGNLPLADGTPEGGVQK